MKIMRNSYLGMTEIPAWSLVVMIVFIGFLTQSNLHASEKKGTLNVSLEAHHYTMNDGLPSNTIRCIHQDKQGFVWIATSNGLCRYDGHGFIVYHPLPTNAGEPGLASSSVTKIIEDGDNYLWIQCSPRRLSCFDLIQGRFIDFTNRGKYDDFFTTPLIMPNGDVWIWNDNNIYKISHQPSRKLAITEYPRHSLKLPDGDIQFINEDADGTIWLGATNGLFCITPKGEVHVADSLSNWRASHTWKNEIHFITVDGTIWCNPDTTLRIENTTSLHGMSIKDKVVNDNKTCDNWTLFTNRRIYKYNFENRSATRDKKHIFPTPRVVHLQDKDFLVYNQPKETYYSDSISQSYTPLPLRKIQGGRLGYENYQAAKDRKDNIWISTAENGLFFFNPDKKELHHINHKKYPELLQTDVLYDVCVDNEGSVWIGTNNTGLTLFSQASFLPHERIIVNDTEEMGYENYIRLLDFRNNALWVGTRQNLVQSYDTDFNLLTNQTVPINIYDQEIDSCQTLWKGTRGRGIIVGHKEIKHQRDKKKALQNGDIFKIFRDKKGRMWLGTFGGGLCYVSIDSTTNSGYAFQHFLTESYGMLRVRDIIEDQQGRMWVAGNDGLCILTPDSLLKSPTSYQHYSYTNGTFPATEIHTLLNDKSGKYIWAGTIGHGLIRCQLDDNGKFSYTVFTENDGLASNTITSLIHDNQNFIWIGTTQGLSRLNPTNNSLHSFVLSRHPQENSFTESASCILPDGRLVFGTIRGLVVIDPSNVVIEKHCPSVILTDLWINGSRIPYIVEDDKSISIPYAKHIKLSHEQNSFELHFSMMNFDGSRKERFRWYLEGYEEDWNDSSTRNYATYRYLSPGKYVFHVEAIGNDGLWHEKETCIKVTILPPWWQTWWAYLLWISILILIMYIIFKQINRVTTLRRQIKIEKQLAQFKMSLFANLSHEFRTPLTLIQVALERLISVPSQPKESRQALDTMKQGIARMTRLSYEIMQFHKMESGQLSLLLQDTDVVDFVRNIVNSFSEMACQKSIDFEFQTWSDSFVMPVDRNHLDKIVYNLLSNAFKYTPAKKENKISIRLKLTHDGKLALTVTDTGLGVPMDKREQLFSRYMHTRMSGNSIGIGLNLSAELALVHHGTLNYQPRIITTPDGDPQEHGSIFTLMLPTQAAVYRPTDFLQADEGEVIHNIHPNEPSCTSKSETTEKEENLPLNPQHLLIVEDDPDIRRLLVDEMGKYFEVKIATDGQEGLEKIKEEMPDLVISDVMMPRMDGFELTRCLRSDFTTCHIPIVLLTAFDTPDKQMQGFEQGADAYIAKPFNRDVLRSRIIQLITQRQRLREKYSQEPGMKSTEICTNNQDRQFMDQLNSYIEENINNSDLQIKDMASQMNMSRTVFYNKVKGITGVVPVEYLRIARLKKASEMLLTQPASSMADVSYAVGFNDPLYFSRVFKKQFGVPPSAYRLGKRANMEETGDDIPVEEE